MCCEKKLVGSIKAETTGSLFKNKLRCSGSQKQNFCLGWGSDEHQPAEATSLETWPFVWLAQEQVSLHRLFSF